MKALASALTAAGVAATSYAAYAATTWWRYGRPPRAHGGAVDPLLDDVMPSYEVCDRHHADIAAPPAVTFEAATQLELEESRIIRAIFRGRELILRSRPAPATATRPRGLLAQMQALGWGILGEAPGEVVLGAVTKPWEPDPVFRPLAPDAFRAFAEPDFVKIAWTLRTTPRPDGGAVFWTETRAIATDPGARRKFRAYWALLSPGIRLIRRAIIGGLRAAADRAWRLPGDDRLPDARTVLTHAIPIEAPPADVWPWLVQMGGQRAGWYSWDRLDNAGVRSADTLVPALQQLEVGDVLPARPTGAEGFEVLEVEPPRALILGSRTPWFEGTWAFVLEPLRGGRATRLVTRYRAAYAPSARMTVTSTVLSAAHAIMERKQLQTIKHHAERPHA